MAIYKGNQKVDANVFVGNLITTSISSSSTNDEIAGAKAVYDYAVGKTSFAYDSTTETLAITIS